MTLGLSPEPSWFCEGSDCYVASGVCMGVGGGGNQGTGEIVFAWRVWRESQGEKGRGLQL